MKKQNNSDYFDNLLKNSKASKKQIALYLDDAKVERIDAVIKLFSSLSDSKSFARNTLIEEAIDKFLADSEEYLRETYGIDVDAFMEEMRIEETGAEKFDTLILSSTGRGFEETFLGEDGDIPCWYPCKVSKAREPHLKYISIYRGQPHSAITHYAQIKSFEFDEELQCKVCYFEGNPIELPHKIGLGQKEACFFIGAKYTTLESLLNATQADELNFG